MSTIGRVGYPSYDSLTALAAAAATSDIGLVTSAVLRPTYPDAVLAKITATVAQLSGGRLTLGLGVGARESAYLPSERDFDGRGEAFDRQLEFLHRAWRGEPVALRDAGRSGQPRLLGLAYFSTDDTLSSESDTYLRSYYAYAGSHADTIAEDAVRTPQRIPGIVDEFAASG